MPVPRLSLQRWLEVSRGLGFLGPGPVDAHIEHALGYAAVVGAAPRRFLDLGSGGGVPGLVLAAYWATTEAVLLDSSERRAVFLAEAIDGLEWRDRVRVVRRRAEEAGRNPGLREQFPVVVSRSFGPPPVTAECAAPLLAVDGRLVVSEPPEAEETGQDGRWSPEGLAVVGLVSMGERQTPVGRFHELRQAVPCPDRYPRRVGVPAKRPLW